MMINWDNVCEDRFKIVTVGHDYNNLDFKLADIKDLGKIVLNSH